MEAQPRIPSEKSVAIAYVLWLLFGVFGANNFYMGQVMRGIAKLALVLVPFGLFTIGLVALLNSDTLQELVDGDYFDFSGALTDEQVQEQLDEASEIVMGDTSFAAAGALAGLAGLLTLLTWAAVAVWWFVELFLIHGQVTDNNLERDVVLSKHGLR